MLEAGDVQSAQMGENEDQVELIIATAFWCFARPRYRLLARPGHVLVQYALGTHRRSHCNAQDRSPSFAKSRRDEGTFQRLLDLQHLPIRVLPTSRRTETA